jgi:hypothetical protein
MCSLFSDSGGVNIEKAPIVEQLNRAQSAFPDVSGVKVTCTPEIATYQRANTDC